MFFFRLLSLICTLLCGTTNLQAFKVEYIEIDTCVGIDNIIECSLYSNNIKDKTKFNSLTIRPRVTISYKNEMNTFGSRHFSEWTELSELWVESCYMPFFTDQIKGIKNLLHLQFRSCKIQSLAPDAITEHWQLRELDLSFNEITEIPDDFFKANTILNTINLEYNQISKICELINHIDNLEVVIFQGNLLEELPADCFDSYPTFDEIRLGANNLLINSSTNLFTTRGYWGLVWLDLHKNRIENLTYLFDSAPFDTLQYLYLSDNRIKKIPVDGFKVLTEMNELDLSNNLLIEIPHEALSTMTKLRRLLLMNNPIFKIDVEKILSNKPKLWVMNMFRIMCNTMQFSVLNKLQQMGVKIKYEKTTWCRTHEYQRDCESTIVSHPTNPKLETVISEVQIGSTYDYGEWWTNHLNGIVCYDDCGHNFKIFHGSYFDMEQISSITVVYQFDKLKNQIVKYLTEEKGIEDLGEIEEKLKSLNGYFNATTIFTQGYL